MASVLTEPSLVLAALVIEACIGYPHALYRRITHPVVWVGRLIDLLERRFNDTNRSDIARRLLGVAAVVFVAGVAAFSGYALQTGAATLSVGGAAVALIATVGLAQRSLHAHVDDVLQCLIADDLPGARIAVARIVGRDTDALDEAGVAAAALESLAESFNDGVLAPAFWFLVCGLPGLFAYKAINTADSLIGHREARLRMFGWAAARTDDAAGLLPARLAGVLLTIAGGGGLRIMWRDAGKHSSPNAGWPEAALAGALAIQIGGPAAYDRVRCERPVFGEGPRPQADDLRRGLHLYMRACGLLWAALALAWTIRAAAWP